MTTVYEWAQSVKGDLVSLQEKHGIPALFAAAQMAHESAISGGNSLSSLATECQNYAGLKWATWQGQFGCKPARYGTWEEIDGVATAVEDAFCASPTWETWLEVYASLLTADRYRPALAFAHDPLLYGFHVWQAGWATDSRYIVGIARWMAALWDIYQDTIPGKAPARRPVTIVDGEGKELCQGWLEGSRTIAPIRPVWEGVGRTLEWQEEGPKVILK